MTAPLRRSTRAKASPKLAYESELTTAAKKKRKYAEADESESDYEAEDEVMAPADDDDADSGSDSDEADDYSPNKAQKKQKSPPKNTKKTPSKTNKKKGTTTGGRKIQLKIRKPAAKKRRTTGGGTKGSRAAQTALTKMAKSVLGGDETPENSLLAALVASSKPIDGIESINPRDTLHRSVSVYTPQLEGIARRILQDQESNGTDSMHIQLLNLMFRSVGGSVDTIFKPGTDLDELMDDEWNDLMTEVVEVMQQGEDPLLTASAPTTLGAQAYRQIYTEFWYRLGNAVLNHNSQDSTEFSSNQFQVEMMKDLISRLSELVMVGQPDLRAASTMAIWQLSMSCMERTVELEQKLQVGSRQSKASKTQSKKLQAVKHSMDAWKRNKAELDNLVETSTLQGVFIHRYRDSNPQIRVDSLNMIARLTIVRPDLFLKDKYLKYLGWMVSDKSSDVRVAALKGLLAPFREIAKKKPIGPKSLAIDVHYMQNVCRKFLNRFVDCTEDSQSNVVQELAMELLLAMLQNEFLDDWDDDNGWDQINLKAIDPSTTPKTRKDALYFVLDQIPSFDTAEDDNRSSMSGLVNDKRQVERLEGIASWLSAKLSDGSISIEKVKVDRADLLVESLREMPEHNHLVVNWSAMMRAIRTRSENPQQGRSGGGREEVTKQRILLRMLACSADAQSEHKSKKKQKGESSDDILEALSLDLLKGLPVLLPAFKGDVMSLRSITQLPKYLIPSVFSLPSKKNDFSMLVKNLCRLFLESTDEIVLSNITENLATFVDGDHTRVAEVRSQVKKLASALNDRLMELLRAGDPEAQSKDKSPVRVSPRNRGRSSRKSPGSTSRSSDGEFLSSPEVDMEHSLYLSLLRWRVLLQGCPLAFLFDVKDDDDEVEEFFNAISEAIGKKLADRKPIFDDEESRMDDGTVCVALPEIWKTADAAVHGEVAMAVDETLQILNIVLMWKLYETRKERNFVFALARDNEDEEEAERRLNELESEEVDPEDLTLLQMRKRVVNLLGMCFDQFLPTESEDLQYTEEHDEFSLSVQSSAGRNACNIRVMFPREWKEARDPVLRALALTSDNELIGGFARYFQFKEPELVGIADTKDSMNPVSLVSDTLVPLGRALTSNWNDGNRLEAGLALMHITGSGPQASEVVHKMARHLKRINPPRFLEAQMYCLQRTFTEWVENDPDDLSTDRPSEEQLQEHEREMQQHNDKFQSIENRAGKLSQCLGVGKLSDKRLKPSMIRFMQEGVRFAFEVSEDLVLGSRLPFLTILSKYSPWIKKDKEQLAVLEQTIIEREDALYDHEEFEDVHEDDLAALAAFRESLGLKEIRKPSQFSYTQDTTTVGGRSGAATPSPGRMSTSSRRQMSTGGSRSRYSVSTQNSLAPVYEEDGSSEEADQSPSPQKARRLLREESPEGGEHMSAVGSTQEKIDEGDENINSSSDASNAQENIEEADQEHSDDDSSAS